MSYEELSREMTGAPLTWLPGLLQRLIRTCSIKPVFKDKAAFLRYCEKSWDMNGVGEAELRDGGTQ
jgi:hypothetical protein